MMLTMTERTLILIKPDGVSRGLVGEVISRIERKGLKLVALDLRVADEATAKEQATQMRGARGGQGDLQYAKPGTVVGELYLIE